MNVEPAPIVADVPVVVAAPRSGSAPMLAPQLPQVPGAKLLASLPVRSPAPTLGPIDDSDVLAALFDAPTVSAAAPVVSRRAVGDDQRDACLTGTTVRG